MSMLRLLSLTRKFTRGRTRQSSEVFDKCGAVIETHEHTGDFNEW
jgi:hypothetical protein